MFGVLSSLYYHHYRRMTLIQHQSFVEIKPPQLRRHPPLHQRPSTHQQGSSCRLAHAILGTSALRAYNLP